MYLHDEGDYISSESREEKEIVVELQHSLKYDHGSVIKLFCAVDI
jgi:hypothetical protein